LAHVQDLFSRLIVGWSMADHLRSDLVVDALEMAIYRRRPARGLVHHSDQGCPAFYRWRNQFGGMKADDVKRLKEPLRKGGVCRCPAQK
jgi:transposase InsO family protein